MGKKSEGERREEPPWVAGTETDDHKIKEARKMLLRANSEEERQRPLKGSKKVKAQKPNKNSKVSLYTHNHTNFENPEQLKKFVTWKPRLCLFSQTLLCQCVWRTKKKVFFLSSTTKQKPEEDQMQRGSLPAMENTIATEKRRHYERWVRNTIC